jgi:hypothetical protein
MKITRLLGGLLLAAAASSQAAPLLSEGFDNIGTLSAAGWVMTNNSTPGGSTGWFQGNSGVFPADTGAADSYIAANFLNAPAGGAVSNWLISPQLTFTGPASLAFSLRLLGTYTDTVEVYFSPNGASADVGNTSSSVGVFTLRSTLSSNSDTGWLTQSLAIGAAGANDGRFAFRYVVSDTNLFGDYIGIDNVSVTAVPEPAAAVLMAFGLAGLALAGRRRWTAPR